MSCKMSINKICNIFKKTPMLKFIIAVISLCLIHWILVQSYIYFCTELSLWGVFTHFFTMGSPVCQFLNYLQYELSKNYISIWAAAGVACTTWLITKITG